MENTQLMWSKSTKTIYNGVLLYSIAGVVSSIITPIVALTSTAGSIMSMADSGSAAGGLGFLVIFRFLLTAAIIVGYILFVMGLGQFRNILQPADAKAIGKVRTAIILSLIAVLIAYIPILGGVASGILVIVAFILMIMGYIYLKSSPTFPAKARSGASLLFTAMILNLVGAILAFIPFLGGILAAIIAIITFFMVIKGWANIKNADPAVL